MRRTKMLPQVEQNMSVKAVYTKDDNYNDNNIYIFSF